MRTLGALALVAAMSSSAFAQPGVPTYEPRAVMQVRLTVDEQFLMERGYISTNEHIGGGLAAAVFGFGVGQAIQRRWADRGWIFTVADGIAGFVFLYGFFKLLGCTTFFAHDPDSSATCADEDTYAAMIAGGLIGGAAIRVWQVADAFIVPVRHNARLTALRERLGLGMPLSIAPYVVPVRSESGAGGVAGIAVRF